LTRSSLGQLANIGDLYDARTDRFTGHSVITASTEHLHVNSTHMESNQQEFLIDSTSCDRLDLLVNDKELQLSVVLGLVVPEQNIADFIDHNETNTSPTNGVLLRTVKILREQLSSIGDIKSLVSKNESATHVVVGVEWGATVAVCLDQNDKGVQSNRQVDGNLQEHLQMLMSTLRSGAPPNPQVISEINSTYTIRCFSNGLPQDNQPCRVTLEQAIARMSDLPRLTQSVNDGKGAPQSFILVPISSLTKSTKSMSSRVEESMLDETLAHFGDVQKTKHNLVEISHCDLKRRKTFFHEQEINKIYEFFLGFQQAEKNLYKDVATAVVEVRSGRLDQSRLADIIGTFSSSGYSRDSLKVFRVSIKPTLQKLKFLDKIIREGIVIGDAQTDLHDIKRNSHAYVLYATESAKDQHPHLWEENKSAFLDTLRQKKKYHRDSTAVDIHAAKFAYVDYDIVRGADVDKGIAIYHYKNGQVVSRDVARERTVNASLNITTSSQKKQPCRGRPAKLAVVELPCPGARSACDSIPRIWSCKFCREEMEYGFDDHFYCSCGRAPVKTFSYKCNGEDHGDDLLEFDPGVVEEHVKKLKPIKDLNILFLGETGVGKSTWINGFANYISYSTLSEAANNDDACLIPTKFTMMNQNYEEVEIKTGTDRNEDQQVGQSSTQMPQSYSFRYRRYHIKIIDTPGIGDTRGLDQDRINFQHTMTHLSHYDEIHGICFLLKPNIPKLSVTFKFCIKELLTHLHRDACKNIVFCFTNARGTFYTPGDTLPALRELISSPDIDLRLCRETIYCIDNESVRFLAALKQGVEFDEDARGNYSKSWETSVKETLRLIDYISTLPPHKVKNTLSLNDARRLIVEISRPLAEITSTIQNNISVVEQRRQEVLESTQHKEDLTNKLYIPAIDLETTPLDYPRTVCTARSCVKYISVGGVQKIDYVRHCHPHCYLTGIERNIVNCVALQKCAAMDPSSYKCTQCGCPYAVHMHITYDTAQVQTQVIDHSVEEQIKDKATKIEIIQQYLLKLEGRIKDLEAEKRQVVEISAKFGCFLKHNAIATLNDSIADYLDYLIDLEKGKIGAGGDRNTLKELEKMKAMYEQEVIVLEKAINDSQSDVSIPTVEKIKRLYDELCHLPITGPMLTKAMIVVEAANIGAIEMKEHRIQRQPLCGNRIPASKLPKAIWESIRTVRVSGKKKSKW